MRRMVLVLMLLSAATIAQAQAYPSATPIMDLGSNLYLGTYSGGLFEHGLDSEPSDHAALGVTAGAAVQPLGGVILVVGIGMSNWTSELCVQGSESHPADCLPGSFFAQAAGSSQVNQPNLVMIDCAYTGQTASDWINDSNGDYTQCNNLLSQFGYAPSQVQVVLYKGADATYSAATGPNLSADATCANNSSWSTFTACGASCNANPAMDACVLEGEVGQMARFVKAEWPSTKQIFLHSRTYGGFAGDYPACAPNCEISVFPFEYEGGFAMKAAIEAQVLQDRSGTVDPIAGDLSATVAPWITWGGYFWASGNTPRSDGMTWTGPYGATGYDMAADNIHPSSAGTQKIGTLELNFFLASPFSPWFRAGDGTPVPTPSATPTPAFTPSATPTSLATPVFAPRNYGRVWWLYSR